MTRDPRKEERFEVTNPEHKELWLAKLEWGAHALLGPHLYRKTAEPEED